MSAASDAQSKVSDALSKATDALSKITAGSASWDKGSDALSKASDALSKITVVSDAASSALAEAATISAAVTTLDGQVVKSVPGANSYAVHEIMITSASLIKYVWSSVAAA